MVNPSVGLLFSLAFIYLGIRIESVGIHACVVTAKSRHTCTRTDDSRYIQLQIPVLDKTTDKESIATYTDNLEANDRLSCYQRYIYQYMPIVGDAYYCYHSEDTQSMIIGNPNLGVPSRSSLITIGLIGSAYFLIRCGE